MLRRQTSVFIMGGLFFFCRWLRWCSIYQLFVNFRFFSARLVFCLFFFFLPSQNINQGLFLFIYFFFTGFFLFFLAVLFFFLCLPIEIPVKAGARVKCRVSLSFTPALQHLLFLSFLFFYLSKRASWNVTPHKSYSLKEKMLLSAGWAERRRESYSPAGTLLAKEERKVLA